MRISYSEMFLARDFAQKIVKNIDSTDFMDGRNTKRTTVKVFQDNLKGKLAEICVANHLHEITGVSPVLDFDIYDIGVGDGFDVVVGPVSIDVKASTSFAKKIMVEESKVYNWYKHGKPSYLCMVSVEGNTCEYLFGIPYREFEEKAEVCERGSCIPNTNVPLKATNYLIDKKNCYPLSHLASFVNNHR